ncbi:MAG: hypothetical protein WA174_12960, partial [Rhodoferax sp.]
TDSNDTATDVAAALAAQMNGQGYNGGTFTASAVGSTLSVTHSATGTTLNFMVTMGQPLYLDGFGNETTVGTNPPAMSGGVQLKGLHEVNGNGDRLYITETGLTVTALQLVDYPNAVPKYYQDADTNRVDSGASPLYTVSIGGSTFYTNHPSNEPLMVKANVTRDIIFSTSTDVDSSVAGLDALVVSNSAFDGGDTGTLTATQLSGLGLESTIDFSNLESLSVTLGGGADTFSITGSVAASVALVTNAGTDSVTIATAGGGSIALSTGADSDTVNVDGTGTGGISMLTGTGTDTVTLEDIDGNASINTGDDADTILVSSDGLLLEDIDATLTLDAGAGIDTITVNDSGDGDDEDGTLTSTTITGLGMGGSIGYANTEVLNLLLGGGANGFTIVSTHGQTTNLDTGAGADAVLIETIDGVTNVSTGTGADSLIVGQDDAATTAVIDRTLSGIDAVLTLIAGADADTLLVDTRSTTADLSGTLTATQFTGLGMGGRIDYAGLEDITVELGDGSDNFDVTGIGAAHVVLHG